jgi:NAD-dependent dihydropyrimidine dehydrogenase PreA subunit
VIELISKSRCIGCNICVNVCPTNVFNADPGEVPVIARKEDCQTCFLCEAYCPADAMFVAAEAHRDVHVDEQDLIAKGLLGHYRRKLGWEKGGSPAAIMDRMHELRVKLGQNG